MYRSPVFEINFFFLSIFNSTHRFCVKKKETVCKAYLNEIIHLILILIYFISYSCYLKNVTVRNIKIGSTLNVVASHHRVNKFYSSPFVRHLRVIFRICQLVLEKNEFYYF